MAKTTIVKVRREDEIAREVAEFLRGKLSTRHYLVEAHSNLLYRFVVDSSGKTDPEDYLNPTRGQGAFQADIVVRDQKHKVPLVVIELKSGGFSTHDVLTYSTKAIKHKEIYPYLRYGFLVTDRKFIRDKFFVHNVGFDFALAVANDAAGREELLHVVKRQLIICSRLISIPKEKKNEIWRYENIVRISAK